MRKVLITAQSSFQLLAAIQMKIELFTEDDVVLFIHDYTRDYLLYAERLRKTGLFSEVITCGLKRYFQYCSFAEKVGRCMDIFTRPEDELARWAPELAGKYFTDYLYNNTDMFQRLLYASLYETNPLIRCARYEEGYSIYLSDDDGYYSHSIERVSRALHYPSPVKDIKNYYVFHPELFQMEVGVPIIKIPCISRLSDRLRRTLSEVYDVRGSEAIRERFIFMETIDYAAEKSSEDVDMVNEIADLVGKENILIKMHPRNPVDRFTPLGYKVYGKSSVPWEVLQMNNDFSDKVFVTVNSSSVLSSALYFDDAITTVFLYKCMKKKPKIVGGSYDALLARLQAERNYFIFPANVTELQDCLKNI